MSKTTKREKVLILVLVCLVLTYGAIQFAILPMYRTYSNTLLEHEYYEKEQARIEALINGEAQISASYEGAQRDLTAVQSSYPAEIPNEKIDNILTGLCRTNGLEPVSLYLSSAADIEITPEEETAGAAEAEAGTDEATEPESSRFTAVTARMVVNGGDRALRDMLNAVEKIENIRITQMSFARDPRDPESGMKSITLNFEITMLKELGNH